MPDIDREAIRRRTKELSPDVTDEQIDRAMAKADEAVELKRVELALLPLRRHLFLEHHVAGPTGFMGLKELETLHETAPRQGGHPWECEKGQGCPSLCTPCAHEAIMKLPRNPDLTQPKGEEL